MVISTEPTTYRRMGLSLLAFALGVGMCVVLASHRVEMLWRACLLGVVACWLVSVGAAGLIAIGNLTGGRWALAARPFYTASMKTLPFVVLMFIPIAFALPQIYPWANPSEQNHLHFSAAKAAYFSPAFFLARAVIYIGVWLFVAWWLGSVSRLDVPPGRTFRMRRAGALSLVLLAPTVTFAAFDWAMSLEPEWYSSIYGAVLTAGGVVAAHALAVYGLARMPFPLRERILAPLANPDHDDKHPFDVFGDLGNLLLAFIMVWTYFSLSQFIIIWSANLPSEIAWYLLRLNHGWQYVAIAVIGLCFVAPFFSLLSRDAKRSLWTLAGVAMIVLVGYGLNMYWTIVPAFHPIEVGDHLACVSGLLAVGGLWSAINSWQLGNVLNEKFRAQYNVGTEANEL
jgi:hypothetical protein